MINKSPSPAKLAFSDIKIGSEYSFNRTISNEDIANFAKLSGDFNPIHVDPHYKKTIYKQNIVHGMLASSLFSALVGMHCPGENCLYLSQEIKFIKPIYPDQIVKVRGTLINKVDALKILDMKTEILVDGEVVIKGQARVKVLE